MLEKLREYPLVPTLVVLTVLVVLFLAMLPYIAPTHHYTARIVPAEEESELPQQVFIEGARRNEEVRWTGDLSSQQLSVLRKSRRGEIRNNSHSNRSLFRGTEYVATNSTLLKLAEVNGDSRSRLQVTELSTSEGLPIFAVSISEFTNYSYFYAPEREQHIVRSTIENGRHNSSIVVGLNHTVVPYRDSYYILNDEGTTTFP